MYKIDGNSFLKVHDIFDPLPAFMLVADCIFVDIPYNQSLLTNFINRDGVKPSQANTMAFSDFLTRLFECVGEIAPKHCFVETGKEALPDVIVGLRGMYRHVTFYNSTYYHKSSNKSYIAHGTNDYKRRRYAELEDLDEADAIRWIALNHECAVMGDLCMGKGLVGMAAYEAGKPFVGTEINNARLDSLIRWLKKKGAEIAPIGERKGKMDIEALFATEVKSEVMDGETLFHCYVVLENAGQFSVVSRYIEDDEHWDAALVATYDDVDKAIVAAKHLSATDLLPE